MNEETEAKILKLLDVIAVEVAAGRSDTADFSAKVDSLETKFDSLDVKVDRIERRLGRVETRVENVETELRSFRYEFERRIASLER